MRHFKLFFNHGTHISRLMTAFHFLEQSGEATIEYLADTDLNRKTLHSNVVVIESDGRCAAFDMSDGFGLNNPDGTNYLKQIDLYFKRSYSREIDKGLPESLMNKVRPYGFDYFTTYPNNPLNRSAETVRGVIRDLIGEMTGYNQSSYAQAFEKNADPKSKNLKIIFMTRLWDPNEISLTGDISPEIRDYREYMIEEREKINSDRVQLIKELKRQYGKAFTGGLQNSAFTERYAPDLIISHSFTRKKAYLQRMKNSDICIGSMGLHKSTGWKTGEYIAASRAIVAEKMYYSVPGNFEAGVNYLPFQTVDECLANVERLYHDPTAVYEMKKANQDYYRNYLEPKVQIKNALSQLFE